MADTDHSKHGPWYHQNIALAKSATFEGETDSHPTMTLLVGVGLGVLGTVAWYERKELQRHITLPGLHLKP